MRVAAILSLVVFAFVFCRNNSTHTVSAPVVDSTPAAAGKVLKDSDILAVTKQVLTLLKNKDYHRFSTFIHPVLGTRFSPYGFVDTINDTRLSRDQFLAAAKLQNSIHWGSFDGSGDSIILALDAYVSKFVYNADFLTAPNNTVNKMIAGGNSLNNLAKIYPDGDFTESYFPGFEEKYGGMDWTCLRLVYKKYNGTYYLVAVVHDQWTV